MKWIKLKDRMPDKNIDGSKVLLHRIIDGPQAAQAITIHDTRMVRHCNPDETHWMALPDQPKIESIL